MVAAVKAHWHLFDCGTEMCEAGLTAQDNVDGFEQQSQG